MCALIFVAQTYIPLYLLSFRPY